MGCNCGGSTNATVQQRLAQQRAAGERRPESGPKAPGYYSGPERPPAKPATESQQ